jgi:hypothetical protein
MKWIFQPRYRIVTLDNAAPVNFSHVLSDSYSIRFGIHDYLNIYACNFQEIKAIWRILLE